MDLPGENRSDIPVVEYVKTYRVPLLLGFSSLICIGIAIVLIVKSTQTADPIVFSESSGGENITIGYITVDVAGAVEKPGVYKLPMDSRIEDAIASAGGFSSNADTEFVAKAINRAARVVDGGKIYIPSVSDSMTSHNVDYATLGSTTMDNSGVNQSNGLSPNDNLISINTATISQLDTLPGVGSVTAQKIIDNRPYGSPEDLVIKKVVGKSAYEKIKPRICL